MISMFTLKTVFEHSVWWKIIVMNENKKKNIGLSQIAVVITRIFPEIRLAYQDDVSLEKQISSEHTFWNVIFFLSFVNICMNECVYICCLHYGSYMFIYVYVSNGVQKEDLRLGHAKRLRRTNLNYEKSKARWAYHFKQSVRFFFLFLFFYLRFINAQIKPNILNNLTEFTVV